MVYCNAQYYVRQYIVLDGFFGWMEGKLLAGVDIRLSVPRYSFVFMDSKQVIRLRSESQGFSGGRFSDVAGLVGWMGCVQAQDYAMAKWAIGVRLDGLSEAAVEGDFNAGRILRTHVLRPTWHFVLPEDIGWMVRLSAARIRAFTRPWHRRLGIDAVVLRRSKKIMVKAMEGGKFLT